MCIILCHTDTPLRHPRGHRRPAQGRKSGGDGVPRVASALLNPLARPAEGQAEHSEDRMRMTPSARFKWLAIATSILAPGCSFDPSQPTQGSLAPSQCAPQNAFSYAICVCDNMADVGELFVGKGPSGPGSVGVNGNTQFVNRAEIQGDLVSGHTFTAATDTVVAGDLHAGGNATAIGKLRVGEDLSVGGILTSVGPIDVAGSLRVAHEPLSIPLGAGHARAPYKALANPPCGCDAARFDVARAVEMARANNDNASANLDHLISVGNHELTLAGGRYYFPDSVSVGNNRFIITGPTSIYVAGSVVAVGKQNFEIRSGGSLDLYVAGVVATVGELQAGAPGNPSAFRMYLGGPGRVLVSVGKQDLFGSIYAPDAVVAFVGDTNIEGALFAHELAGVGRLGVRYAGSRPNGCEVPPVTPPPVVTVGPPPPTKPPTTPPQQPKPAPTPVVE